MRSFDNSEHRTTATRLAGGSLDLLLWYCIKAARGRKRNICWLGRLLAWHGTQITFLFRVGCGRTVLEMGMPVASPALLITVSFSPPQQQRGADSNILQRL
jgi:hypothetical protein